MKRTIYSADSETDLDDIYDYSVREWGAVQADKYVVGIRSRIAGLASGATASRAVDEIAPGLRRALAGSHVVFFREDEAAVTVVRVLHQRMDVGR
ncbi:type II toxin-antitoxin system RelE/ParE family toxin [Rhodobacterales bacterium HKCCE4037]|nr:type II toxin-antitoxin system RelE/ParE family toxin [Rhodobacterales bacterium HKCCE4037]